MSLRQWDTVEKDSVQQEKIRVVFLPAEAGHDAAAAAVTPARHSLVNGVGNLDGLVSRTMLTCTS